MNPQYDFVIVGGGTSGLVVAARLTEDPNTSVLVLEAGGDYTADPRIRTPAFWLSVLGSPDFDWDYQSVPQKGLDGKVIPLSQGKLLGGSSAINGLAFVANSKAAVDAWAGFGNSGWDWNMLAPYFKKAYTLSRPSTAASEHLRVSYIQESVRGANGPIQVSFPEEVDDPLPAAWVDTIAALGYPASGDPFSGEFRGGYVNALSVDPASRTRSDAATAYFEPVKARPNLHVVMSAHVTKLIFDTSGSAPKAVGVQVKKDGETVTFRAEKEVVLAAGAFGTPKLLELSGVGSRELLERFNIPVFVDNPNVGENLQDHPVSSISFEVNDGVKTLDALGRQEPDAVEAAMQEYVAKKAGPFAVGNYTGSLLPVPDFVGPEGKSTLEKVLQQIAATNPDLVGDLFSPHHASFVQSLLNNPAEGAGNVFLYAACANVNPESVGADIIARRAGDDPGNFITICAALLFPLSRGSAHISSADPAEKPTINPRYLEHPLDLEVLARYLRYAETIIRTEPLARFVKLNGRRNPGAPVDLRDLNVAKEYTKNSALSCWHPTSTCAMLPRECGGVVDPQLRVYGVEGLRIVDASVIPLATRGNTQTTVYAVAERAADLIKEQYGDGS
ncbi:Oxygen-dependent choline dehydrogenase [Madurella mycetomatis]|uniref:Oxygen-dependent choline dehydrogenase n=1 Tax=Madurella mycetomatis TaxID=100816 RepID=A0A175VPT5_9PEZI|nr:Oxygen-dependent choline dehydrogenase [Madurella mycetomatis]